MKIFQNISVLKTALLISALPLSMLLLGKDAGRLVQIVSMDPAYSHIMVIPFISAFFLWRGRKSFLSEKGNKIGLVFALCAVAGVFILNLFQIGESVSLTLKVTGVIVAISGLFVSFWGWTGLKKSLFSFIFLLLAIPIPPGVLNSIVGFLQWGSAVMVDFLYLVVGQSYLRDGNEFHLDTISIFIAPECSGIRSTMALIITGAVAVELYLKRWPLKVFMIALIIPLSLLKNAIRIFTITMLAQHINQSFLTDSFLHHSGGVVFYLIVLAIFFPLLLVLSKIENRATLSPVSASDGSKPTQKTIDNNVAR
ncbi:MAG: exosortase/archaeosortase family protein [Fibrobacter sp.]|nr:exosortase/archaeosortase family protein [Fibrobacter sp.]